MKSTKTCLGYKNTMSTLCLTAGYNYYQNLLLLNELLFYVTLVGKLIMNKI